MRSSWLVLSAILAACAPRAAGPPPAQPRPAADAHQAGFSDHEAALPDDPDVRACVAGEYEHCPAASKVLLALGTDAEVTARLRGQWTRACDGGSGLDCTRAAFVASDAPTMFELMIKGCTNGFGPICGVVGSDLVGMAQQENSQKMLSGGLNLLQHGCDLRDANSCRELAWLYHWGNAMVPADKQRAYAYLHLGCDELHDDLSCEATRNLECEDGLRKDCPEVQGGVVGGVVGGELEGEIGAPPPPPPPPPPTKSK